MGGWDDRDHRELSLLGFRFGIMGGMSLRGLSKSVGLVLVLLLAGCGGRTALTHSGTGGSAAGLSASAGGMTDTSTGGASDIPTGGASGLAPRMDGSANGGASGTGTGGTLACTGVTCPFLPTSCKRIVQEANDCCPICADTGCAPCVEATCAVGTHKEQLNGACCPTCVANPPDPCAQGKQDYAAVRAALLDRYASVQCQDSDDCTVVLEDNACGTYCSVPITKDLADSYQANLLLIAGSRCATCPVGPLTLCERMAAACLNGKCIAVDPS